MDGETARPGWASPWLGVGCRGFFGVLGVLAFLAILPYVRALGLPMISDDYLQVQLGRTYGPFSNWPALAADPLYRSRATSILLTYWTEQWFGVSAVVFSLQSLAFHIVNTWLVFTLGVWRRVGWRISGIAAAFFALYQGHQEAVIWYAALPELLVFLFVATSILLFIGWLQCGNRKRWWFYGGALLGFLLALLSKESAVVAVPLLGLAAWLEGRNAKTSAAAVAPFAVLAAWWMAGIFAGAGQNQHFGDGTFSLSAPFWRTWFNSLLRMLWIWTLVALLFLVLTRQWRNYRGLLASAGVWTSLTLLPYCFLTYMPHVPSRHTYLASAGLGFVAAAALLALRAWSRPRPDWRFAVATVVCLFIAHQAGYVWTRKHRQYVERAAPTEALIRFVKNVSGSVQVHCFPIGFAAARQAVEIGTDLPQEKLLMGPDLLPDVQNVFCLGDQRHPSLMRRARASSTAATAEANWGGKPAAGR